MLITSGYNFEGYDIIEYYGHASAQVVLGTGFFSSASVSFADLLGTTSNAYEDKLDKAEQIGKSRLINKARQNGCNAIIGLDVDYTTFANDIMGVIVNGTLVKVTKQVSDKTSKIYINSYYNLSCGIRCLESTLSCVGEDKIYLHINGKKYFSETINAIEASMHVTTIFGETYTINNIMFADIEENEDSYTSEYVLLNNLLSKDFKLIKKIGIVITKYVSSNTIVDIDTELNLESPLSEDILRGLRNHKRSDTVLKPYKTKDKWYCCCGKENPVSSDICVCCKQKENLDTLKYTFDGANSKEDTCLTEHIAYAIKNTSSAKQIFEYLSTIDSNNDVLYNDVLPRLKKIKDNERLYGNSKNDAVKILNKHFPM